MLKEKLITCVRRKHAVRLQNEVSLPLGSGTSINDPLPCQKGLHCLLNWVLFFFSVSFVFGMSVFGGVKKVLQANKVAFSEVCSGHWLVLLTAIL